MFINHAVFTEGSSLLFNYRSSWLQWQVPIHC